MLTGEEIRGWLLETLRHSCHMEYYLKILGLGNRDPDRPHDISGKFNKLEWDIISGCALAYRAGLSVEEKELIRKQSVLPAVKLHRNQYHHQMWNEYNEDATEQDLRVGALDTVCALLEKRPYYLRSADSPKEIMDNVDELITSSFREIKIPWVYKMANAITEIEKPCIWGIDKLAHFPNIGLSSETYGKIAERMESCLRMLRDEKGYVVG